MRDIFKILFAVLFFGGGSAVIVYGIVRMIVGKIRKKKRITANAEIPEAENAEEMDT